jgi:cell division protein FtsB
MQQQIEQLKKEVATLTIEIKDTEATIQHLDNEVEGLLATASNYEILHLNSMQ